MVAISSSVFLRRHSGPFFRANLRRTRCISSDVSSKSVRFMSPISIRFRLFDVTRFIAGRGKLKPIIEKTPELSSEVFSI